jgi:dolichyl-diphosphooligosaccharide--protein glycosyltransferase
MVDEGFKDEYFTRRQYRGLPYYHPRETFDSLMFSRLYLHDGSRTMLSEALARFRLVWESARQIRRPYYRSPVSAVKIFEFVRGARLSGRAPPGRIVRLRMPLISNRNRPFLYEAALRCGPSGHYRFVVPYPTEAGFIGVKSRRPRALLSCGVETLEAVISERDVRQGIERRYDFN